ncbi:hypothetical protein Lepil_0515 [Leptonema illini DSM 21528]|uniref:Uncharacterized protein n=1 Tax=Leptonema illini DSM 21528 TaxID=929563 RepID=H2CB79_9LEPT|nr:hypothetical protein Lepil_0515 [Leptonema illini DSM 21528]
MASVFYACHGKNGENRRRNRSFFPRNTRKARKRKGGEVLLIPTLFYPLRVLRDLCGRFFFFSRNIAAKRFNRGGLRGRGEKGKSFLPRNTRKARKKSRAFDLFIDRIFPPCLRGLHSYGFLVSERREEGITTEKDRKKSKSAFHEIHEKHERGKNGKSTSYLPF